MAEKLQHGGADLLAPSQLEEQCGLLGGPAVSPALAEAGLCPGSSTGSHAKLEGHPRARVCPPMQLQGILALLCRAVAAASPPCGLAPARLLARGFWHEGWQEECHGAGTLPGPLAWLAAGAGPSLLLSQPGGHQPRRAFVSCHHPCTLHSSNTDSYKEQINVVFGVVAGLADLEGLLQPK